MPKRLKFPIIVKPLCEEASRGISLASVVDNEDALIERVNITREKMKMDTIIEEYVEGRELYVSTIGNKKLRTLPIREMKFNQFPNDEPRIATYKAKWDLDYREKWDIKSVFAGKLPNGAEEKIEETCKRAYRALEIQSYARFDIRITPECNIFIIEANANPCIARCDEVAQSAEKAGISYSELIKEIINLALKRNK